MRVGVMATPKLSGCVRVCAQACLGGDGTVPSSGRGPLHFSPLNFETKVKAKGIIRQLLTK